MFAQVLSAESCACFRRIFFISLLCCVAFGTSRADESVVPDTGVGQALQQWLDAFNSGEDSQLAAYFRVHGPDWMSELAHFRELREQTGGLHLLSVRRADPLFIEFTAASRSGERSYNCFIAIKEGTPLHLAHLRFALIPPGAQPASYVTSPATRKATVKAAVEKLNEFYVFPETARKMGNVIEMKLREGRYDSLLDGIEFSEALTEDLLSVSHDKHLSVTFNPNRGIESGAGALSDDESPGALLRANCGFQKLELLPENIGYVKFDFFADPAICAETAIAAMNFLSHVDVLIFDLRSNGGGDPSMIALISTYLFSGPTHLNDLWTRKTNETQQFWTLPHVPGPRMPSIPVYVLTSTETFSGAEEFANNLKALKRATIVGEVTGGGAHPVAPHDIDGQFTIYVPFARAVNPITHDNWESRGVEPDVRVSASEALDKALHLARSEIGRAAAARAKK